MPEFSSILRGEKKRLYLISHIKSSTICFLITSPSCVPQTCVFVAEVDMNNVYVTTDLCPLCTLAQKLVFLLVKAMLRL